MSNQNSSNNGRQDAFYGKLPANNPNWSSVQRETYNADYLRQQQVQQQQNQQVNNSGNKQ